MDIVSVIESVEHNLTQEEELKERLIRYLSNPKMGISVSDLIFPRRTYFSRLYPEIETTEPEMGYFLAGKAHHYILQTIAASDEYREVKVEWEGIKGHIDIYKDTPIEIKTTRKRKVMSRDELIKFHPHYFEQLGMYCAMTNKNLGRLILFYLNAEEEGGLKTKPKILVYDVNFGNLDYFRNLMLTRKKLLEEAFEKGDPNLLDPCPEWMCVSCKYLGVCRRGEEPPRTYVSGERGRKMREYLISLISSEGEIPAPVLDRRMADMFPEWRTIGHGYVRALEEEGIIEVLRDSGRLTKIVRMKS